MHSSTLFLLITISLFHSFNASARTHNQEEHGKVSFNAVEDEGCVSGPAGEVEERRAHDAAIRGILQEHAHHELLMYEKHLYGYINSHEPPPVKNPMMATADDIENYLGRVDPVAAPAAILVYWRTRSGVEETRTVCVGLILTGRRMITAASPVSSNEELAKLLRFGRVTDARSATPRSPVADLAVPRPPMDLQALSKALLPPPIAGAIEAGRVKTILVVPIGEIGAAPFAALPLPGGRQLIEYADVVIAPGFYTLRHPEPEVVARSSSPMLIVGDPVLANDAK